MALTPSTESRLSSSEIAQFEADGFIVVPEVLPHDEVTRLRGELVALFDGPVRFEGDVKIAPAKGARGGGVRQDIISRYPPLHSVMVAPAFVGALRSLLGDDFLFLPEMAAHDSRYGGWHKDTTPAERAGLTFHREPEFRMVECAFYLQDNDEHGGGLDVVPGSHRTPDVTPPSKPTIIDRVLGKLGRARAEKIVAREGAHSVPSHAGDLVIFDLRLDHMASQPHHGSLRGIPDDRRKLALFFVVGANNAHSRRYKDFIATEYAHAAGDAGYPEDVLALAERHRLTLL